MLNFILTTLILLIFVIAVLAVWLEFLNAIKKRLAHTEEAAGIPQPGGPDRAPLTNENTGATLVQWGSDTRMYWWLLPDGDALAVTPAVSAHEIDVQFWSAEYAAWQVLFLCATDWEITQMTPEMGDYLFRAATPELREKLENHLRESLGEGDAQAERLRRALAWIEQADSGQAA